jgi:hypothetical protein
MKRTILLLTTVLVITYLSSPPVLAASSSQESRTLVVMKILYHQFLGFRAPSLSSRDISIIIDGPGDIDLRGDADDYGGGRIDDKRGTLDDPGTVQVNELDIARMNITR